MATPAGEFVPLTRCGKEQLDGLTAAAVGRAHYRRVTWVTISSALRISEDTAGHRYTDRYLLHRLARFNRSGTVPTTVAGLFPALGDGTVSPEDPTSASDTAGDGNEAGSDRSDRGNGPDQTTPTEPAGAAYNRLAPILSVLIRTAQLTNKEVSGRIG